MMAFGRGSGANAIRTLLLIASCISCGLIEAQLSGAWTVGQQRFSPREKHGMACLADGTIVIAGGRASDGKQSDFWTASPQTGGGYAWTPTYLTGAMSGREAHTLNHVNGRYYVFGGRTDSADGVSELWTVRAGAWTRVSTTAASASDGLPDGRYRHASVTLASGSSFIVLFGTSDDRLFNDVWRFDPSTTSITSGTWTLLHSGAASPAPAPLFDPCCQLRHSTNSIVCFGGTNLTTDTQETWEFSLGTNSWSQRLTSGRLPSRWRLAMCAIVNNHLFVFSGFSSTASDNVAADIVYDLELTSGFWAAHPQGTAGPIARDGGHMCTKHGSTTENAVLVGGLGIDRVPRNDVWRFNVAAKLFQTVQDQLPLPPPRAEHTIVVQGTNLTVFFGRNHGGMLGDVWSFNTETEVWEQLAGSCPYGARVGAAGITRGTTLWAVGGLLDSGPTLEIISFETRTKLWSRIPSLDAPEGRYYHAATVIGTNKVLVIGGVTRLSDHVSEMLTFDPTTRRWSVVAQTPSAIESRRSFGLVKNAITGELLILGGKSDAVLMDRIRVDPVRDSRTSSSWSASVEYLNSTLGDLGAEQRAYIRSEAVVEGSGNHFFVCGGAISGSFPAAETDSCYQYSLLDHTNRRMAPMPTPTYFSAGAYYGRALYIFGGNLVKNSIKQSSTFLNLLQKFRVDNVCPSDSLNHSNCIHCSVGTHGPACAPTVGGSYRPVNSTVENCGPGTFGTTIGAESELHCLPCPAGTYNPNPGRTACLPCPEGARCTIGASELANASVIADAQDDESQPPKLSQEGVPLDWYIGLPCVIAMGYFIVLLFLCCEWNHYRGILGKHLPAKHIEVLRKIYHQHLPREDGVKSRGLTEGEVVSTITDFTEHLKYSAEETNEVVRKLNSYEMRKEMLFFEQYGQSRLHWNDFQLLVYMFFESGVMAPVRESMKVPSQEAPPSVAADGFEEHPDPVDNPVDASARDSGASTPLDEPSESSASPAATLPGAVPENETSQTGSRHQHAPQEHTAVPVDPEESKSPNTVKREKILSAIEKAKEEIAKGPNIRKWWGIPFQKFDNNSEKHNFGLTGESMVSRKTVFGGVVTLFSAITICGVIALLSLFFAFDNLRETQATLPDVAVNKFVSGDFRIQVRTLGVDVEEYCVVPGTQSTCAGDGESVILSAGIFVPTSNTENVTCTFQFPGYCTMTWSCSNCSLLEPRVGVQLTFQHPNWFSSETVTAIAVSSGIQYDEVDSYSRIVRAQKPLDSNKVFKGQPAAVIGLEAVATTWSAPSSIWSTTKAEGTGYHIARSPTTETTIGNEVSIVELPVHVGVPIEVIFEVPTTFLVVEWFFRTDWISFASSILGAISGVLTVSLGIMRTVEFFTRWEKWDDGQDHGKVGCSPCCGRGATAVVETGDKKPDVSPSRVYKRSLAAKTADFLVTEGGMRRREALATVDAMQDVVIGAQHKLQELMRHHNLSLPGRPPLAPTRRQDSHSSAADAGSDNPFPMDQVAFPFAHDVVLSKTFLNDMVATPDISRSGTTVLGVSEDSLPKSTVTPSGQSSQSAAES